MGKIEHLSEEDIKFRYVNPAITSKGWEMGSIFMEKRVQFTAGRINIKGNMPFREPPKFADYVLYAGSTTPIAVIEAKDNQHTVSYGMQQAKEYAKALDAPFAYSTNGMGFAEYDFLTGEERNFEMDRFPTRDELIARYHRESNGGKGMGEKEQKLMDQPFCTGLGTYPPRYYQRNAVNRTLSAIAKDQNRILLVMATGTGKTYTAFQIIWRLLQCRVKKKILYLADRNILVDQSIQQDFKPLGNNIHKIDYDQDMKLGKGRFAHTLYFSLYQQLVGQNGAEHYKELFPDPSFFDLVIVDECHRGSANDDNIWRTILDYFAGATQIGMTATPKETKYQSNITYFGDPVYTYSLKNGIDDGFLAPFKVINIATNIGNGWRPVKGQCDIYGNEIPDRIYNNTDYDYNIIIQDRHREVAEEITRYLKCTDRMSKTIVFCASEEHAELMRQALVNANLDMCRHNSDYVVRITGSDAYGKSKLDYFISTTSPYPVIATTSKLLSTGVDCKMVKLIVLDENISSMTDFKQIVGRGTRIREKEGKMHFAIMDFRNVTRLFADNDWDGEILVDPDYPPKPCPVCGQYPCVCPPEPCPVCGQYPCVCPPEVCPVCGQNPCVCPPKPPRPVVDPDGCTVKIINKIVQIFDSNGKLLQTQSITDYTKENIIGRYANIDTFSEKWQAARRKGEIADELQAVGIKLDVVKKEMGMEDVDDFDLICHIAYGRKALSRRERADGVRRSNIFDKYGEQARKVLNALLDKYMNDGITELESKTVFENDPFRRMGKRNIAQLFGGKEQLDAAIEELKNNIYKIA